METSSALLAICAGKSPVPGELPAQRPVTRSFDVFFDLRLNKRLGKQSSGWWFETLSCPLWRHCNGALYGPCLQWVRLVCASNHGLYSVSSKTPYRQISRSLEAARLGVMMSVSLWNLTGISAVMLQRYRPNLRAIENAIKLNLVPSRLHEILR